MDETHHGHRTTGSNIIAPLSLCVSFGCKVCLREHKFTYLLTYLLAIQRPCHLETADITVCSCLHVQICTCMNFRSGVTVTRPYETDGGTMIASEISILDANTFCDCDQLTAAQHTRTHTWQVPVLRMQTARHRYTTDGRMSTDAPNSIRA